MDSVLSPYPLSANPELRERMRAVRGDLLAQKGVDAIVATLTPDLEHTGSLNRELFEVSGVLLDNFVLENIFQPRVGAVYAVPAFNLPMEHILFVVMTRWQTDFDRNDRDLIRAYRAIMRTAQEMGVKRVAVPVLGTGLGYKAFPSQRAARLAVQTVAERFHAPVEEVRFVCNREDTYEAFVRALS